MINMRKIYKNLLGLNTISVYDVLCEVSHGRLSALKIPRHSYPAHLFRLIRSNVPRSWLVGTQASKLSTYSKSTYSSENPTRRCQHKVDSTHEIFSRLMNLNVILTMATLFHQGNMIQYIHGENVARISRVLIQTLLSPVDLNSQRVIFSPVC
jgi:hypothetical protein